MRRWPLKTLAAAVAVALGVAGAQGWTSARQVEEGPPVLLRTGVVHAGQKAVAGAVAPAAEAGARVLWLVQFRGPVREVDRQALRQLGVEVGDYIPEFAYLVRMDARQAQAVAKLPAVRGVVRYTAQYKVDPALKSARGEVLVRAVGFGGSLKGAVGALAAQGGTVSALAGRAVVARVPAGKVSALAASEDVVYIEPVKENRLFNDKAAGILKVPEAAWSKGLTGEGQIVGIADTGLDTGKIDTMHPDLKDRVQALYSWGRPNNASDPHGHGTHVAGSVLGTGAASGGKVKGMAPGAKLVFQSVLDSQGGLGGIPEDLGQLFQQAYQAGARVHSNSWGVPYDNGGATYDSQAQAVDRFIWEHPDMTILFAAGNDGDHDRDGKVDYGTVSTPGTAKNAITVGASENNRPDKGKHADNPNEVAVFSSRGPTSDGRVKPDVVAPGSWILSVKSSQAPESNFWQGYDKSYAFMGGTSMATPITAGAATLVRQYFVDKLGIQPRASLIKAALIHGAVPIQGTWKDYGWGRVDLSRVIDAGLQVVENEGTALQTGDSKAYAFQVKGGAPFKVTLVWTDYPASPAAGKALVNDLDLEVRTPDGKVLTGNAQIQPGADRTNNVEQVVVEGAAPGTYTVTVKAYNVPQGPQRYSLVVSGAEGQGSPPEPPPQNPQPEPPADKTPPKVVLTAPAAGATLKGTVTLKAEASDDQSGVAKVEFYAGGSLVGTAAAAPWQVTWDTTRVADGSYKLVAKAYDQAGNAAESEPVAVTVANGNLAPEPPQPPQEGAVTEVYTGEVSGWGSVRRVYFDVGAPGPIQTTVETSSALDVDVVIVDPSGLPIWSAKKHGTQSPRVEAQRPGTYSAVIYAYTGYGTYTVRITHPAPASAAQARFTGAVGTGASRSQRFAVTAGKRGALNARLNWTGNGDLDLYLLNAQGRVVAMATYPNTRPETVSWLVDPGTYTLYVVADSGRGEFTLDVTYPK